jgi:hypothetical protein
MKFENIDLGYMVIVEEKVLEKIFKEIKRHKGLETGGILLGRYNEELNTAIVQDAFVPKDSIR